MLFFAIRPQPLLLVFLALLATGCASAPAGPVFRWADTPAAERGRVYLYRVDQRGSLAAVHASIDRNEVRVFRNLEYETFEISAGSHRLRASMRGLGLFSLGWNDHVFRVRPGEVIFLHLDVRIGSGNAPGPTRPRELDITGRSDNQVSENIYIGEKSRSDAAKELEITTRLVGKD